MDEMTTEQLVAEAKRLRAVADEAEEELMLFLYQAEQRPHLWGGSGRTFLQFLEANNICRAARYDGWKRAYEGCGPEAVRAAGMEAAVAAGGLKDEAAAKEVLDQAAVFRRTNGTPASGQTARTMARDVKMRRAVTRTSNKGYLQLAKENDRLRKENDRLKEENAALRAELKSLRKKAA